jgi:phage shock protein A
MSLASEQKSADKWKMVADLAFELGEVNLAEQALLEAKDYNGLLLYYNW